VRGVTVRQELPGGRYQFSLVILAENRKEFRNENAWKPILDEFLKTWEDEVKQPIPLGVTDEDIQQFAKNVETYELDVSKGFIEFLKRVNGVNFAGICLFGINIPTTDPFMRTDIVLQNMLLGKYRRSTVVGSSGTILYVYNHNREVYQSVDQENNEIVTEFSSMNSMLLEILQIPSIEVIDEEKLFENATL
jgi:hypothetical protein